MSPGLAHNRTAHKLFLSRPIKGLNTDRRESHKARILNAGKPKCGIAARTGVLIDRSNYKFNFRTNLMSLLEEGLNGVTVSRKTAKYVAVRRKNERILTVSRKKMLTVKKSITTK